ncbi:MAG: GNAT family N-acetyltransferase [Bacteroidetes bacterium]|nr:GNAT family N-acetyltransferase [Bacteroidota bacterium]
MLKRNPHHVILYPLNAEEIGWLIQGREKLEKKLGLSSIPFDVSGDGSFLQKFEINLKTHHLPWVKEAGDSFKWYTHWLIIDQNINVAVGGISLNSLDGSISQLEMSYFVNVRYENHGYAGEACRILMHWIHTEKRPVEIIADTEIRSFASQKILKKNGFQIRLQSGNIIRWSRVFIG